MEDENARMAAMEAKFEEEIAQLREANETMREAAAEREATAMGTGAAAAARQGPGGQGVSSVNDSLMRLHYSTRSPPKMPNDPVKTLSWIRRFEMFLVSENLKHILTTIPSTGPVDVISCNDRFFLERIHGVQTVRDNWKVWQHLLEATCNTDIEEKQAACNSVYEAWGVVTEWTLPASEAEKTLLSQQLENVKMYSDEDPKTFFIRVDKLVNMMRRVGITKTESQIVHIIVRQLSDEYRRNARLSLKIRLFKAEVMEAMLYGCATWTMRSQDFSSLRTAHHKLLLRIIGFRRKDRIGYKPLSYREVLERTGSERIETTIRKRQLGFAGALVRQGDSRLSKRVMFGRLAVQGPKRGGRPATSWVDCLQKNLEAFGAVPRKGKGRKWVAFGVVVKDGRDWMTAAKNMDKWHRGVEKGAEALDSAWRRADLRQSNVQLQR